MCWRASAQTCSTGKGPVGLAQWAGAHQLAVASSSIDLPRWTSRWHGETKDRSYHISIGEAPGRCNHRELVASQLLI